MHINRLQNHGNTLMKDKINKPRYRPILNYRQRILETKYSSN